MKKKFRECLSEWNRGQRKVKIQLGVQILNSPPREWSGPSLAGWEGGPCGPHGQRGGKGEQRRWGQSGGLSPPQRRRSPRPALPRLRSKHLEGRCWVWPIPGTPPRPWGVPIHWGGGTFFRKATHPTTHVLEGPPPPHPPKIKPKSTENRWKYFSARPLAGPESDPHPTHI